jgi:hypothetical protein
MWEFSPNCKKSFTCILYVFKGNPLVLRGGGVPGELDSVLVGRFALTLGGMIYPSGARPDCHGI